MKKYLALAAVLGAITIIGMSFIAQAEPAITTVTTVIEKAQTTTTAPATTTFGTTTATTTTVPAVAPVADQAATDAAACSALAASPKNDGTQPSEAERADILKKCLSQKGQADVAPAIDAGEVKVETTIEAPAAEIKTEAHH